MSVEDGLVMQLHPGSLRDHNSVVFGTLRAGQGRRHPARAPSTRATCARCSTRTATIRASASCSSRSTRRRTRASSRRSPATTRRVRLGPPWWFHDSIEGMTRYRQLTTETAGIYNTAGFNDDTRAFCSIPARHDLVAARGRELARRTRRAAHRSRWTKRARWRARSPTSSRATRTTSARRRRRMARATRHAALAGACGVTSTPPRLGARACASTRPTTSPWPSTRSSRAT